MTTAMAKFCSTASVFFERESDQRKNEGQYYLTELWLNKVKK